MDWITVKASYTASYTWTAQSLKLQYMDGVPDQFAGDVNLRSLGNVIQNNNVRQINGDLNFETLYNKSKYLAKINKPATKGGSKKSGKNNQGADDSTDPGADPSGGMPGGAGPGGAGPGGRGADKNAPARDDRTPDTPRGRRGRNQDAAAGPGSVGPDGKPIGPDGKAPADKNAADKKGSKEKKKDREPSMAERIALRPLMLVRKARFTYSENYSTVIPGFTPDSKLMGLSEGFDAPGWAFVAGIQPDTKWLDDAARQGWITERPELNQQVTRNYTQNFDAAATIEPFREFRIELNANRQYTRNNTELFKDQDFLLDPNATDFQHRAQRDLGSYTISYFTMNTLFDNDIDAIFDRYKNYRPVISSRLGQAAGNTTDHLKDEGYQYGYGKIHQEVLIPAFIAAYSDTDPNTVNLDVFKTRPSINWKLNYNGLAKLGKLDKIFSSVQISHGYKNTLTVNSYNTDLFFDPTQPYVTDELTYNYIARYEIPQVVINEQLSPLLGVDIKLKNEMSFKVDFKKSRMLAMSFIDYQLAETRSTGYTVGFGYRMKDVNIPFLTGKKKKAKARTKTTPGTPPATPPPGGGRAGGQQANDMNFKFDFDWRDDVTANHSLEQRNEAIQTRGARTISINPSIDYALNRRLKLRLFMDYRKTVPKTSQSFPITTINAGIAVQFTLN